MNLNTQKIAMENLGLDKMTVLISAEVNSKLAENIHVMGL